MGYFSLSDWSLSFSAPPSSFQRKNPPHISRKSMKTGILTFQDYPQLTDDDRLLIKALKKEGFDPHPVIWDQSKEWPFDILLLRAAWDYVDNKHSLLLETLGTIEALQKPLFNTRSMIEWNYNKFY